MLKSVFKPPELGRRVVTELWLYQDGSRILEISTKAAPNEAFQVAAEARVYLSDHGVKVSGQQATKTRTALEFFSKNLASAASAAPEPGDGARSTRRTKTESEAATSAAAAPDAPAEPESAADPAPAG